MGLIYKILSRSDWQAAQEAGHFVGSAVDLADGYIHFSTALQATETARKHFSGQSDLVVLTIKAEALGEALKWEPSRGGDLFPHLYVPLELEQVIAVTEAPLGEDNVPRLGALG